MRLIVPAVVAMLAVTVPSASAGAGAPRTVTALRGIPFVYAPDEPILERIRGDSASVEVTLGGASVYRGPGRDFPLEGITITAPHAGRGEIVISQGEGTHRRELLVLPGILSILPPVIAIVCALLFRQVVVALLAGVWLGSFFLSGFQPVASVLRIVDRYCIGTLAGEEGGLDHISIVVFTLLLGGMVGITSRMGGMAGIVRSVSRIATNAVRGQLAAWLMGIIIFFDDYTNTLIVGNATRPITDRLRISREKLSYIVDSTAAPVTSLAVITSWIGFQISLIDQSFTSMGVDRNPLATLVASLPYSYYPILAVLFVLFVILAGRDYSLMLEAERRARSTGRVLSDSAVPISDVDAQNIAGAESATPRLVNGLVPIAVVIGMTLAGLVVTGRQAIAEEGLRGAGLFDALKESNSFTALLWGSFSGCIAAAALALTQRLLSLTETVASWMNGIRSMIIAIIILVLAWCIGSICIELRTADFLVHHLSGVLAPNLIPLIVFLLAMGIAFATGTSWGTMSILTPIVIPLALGATREAGIGAVAADRILLGSIAAILSGAVFGDHCSPISDTTIMSSMASAADHIDHVRTQLPYAITVGAVALVCGYLLLAAGVPPWGSLLLSAAVLLGIVRFVGKPVDTGR